MIIVPRGFTTKIQGQLDSFIFLLLGLKNRYYEIYIFGDFVRDYGL